jgi:4'-phosphopantetheinyl transferase
MFHSSAAPLIRLAPGSVHLWLASCDRYSEAELDTLCRPVLHPQELEEAQGLHFPADRHQFRLTRFLVRTLISNYWPVAPQDWLFATNEYGRPEIDHPHARASGLSFNLSHTRNLVALVITVGAAAGVDVEDITARQVSLDIARRYFASDEVAALRALSPDQQQYRFFEYWTLKEAYIKARGMGLSLPLDKFSFHFPAASEVALSICDELADDPARWRLWQLRPTPQHLLAICAQRLPQQPTSLTVRWAAPGCGATVPLPMPALAGQADIIRSN